MAMQLSTRRRTGRHSEGEEMSENAREIQAKQLIATIRSGSFKRAVEAMSFFLQDFDRLQERRAARDAIVRQLVKRMPHGVACSVARSQAALHGEPEPACICLVGEVLCALEEP